MALPDGLIPSSCRKLAELAERDPPQAARLAEAMAEANPDDAWVSYSLGWALLCWEHSDVARPHFERALRAHDAANNRLAALHCRHALLLVDVWHSDRAGLDAEFRSLAEAFAEMGEAQAAARAYLDQARQLNVLGQPNEAWAILSAIETPLTKGTVIDAVRWLRAAGIATLLLSDYPRALDYLNRAEQIALREGYALDAARCWVERAWVASRQERLDLALADYQRADELFRHYELPLRIAYNARNIGRVLLMQGKYDEALPALLNAHRHFTGLRRLGDLASVQLLMGNLHYYTARWEAALACYLRAERLAAERGVIGDALVARRNRAMVYREQSRHRSALRLLGRVEREQQEAGDQGEIAEVWSIRAGIYADQGRHSDAFRLYSQAAELFTQLGNLPAAAECRLEQGWLALKDGKLDVAESLLRSVATALEYLPHHRWRIDHGVALCRAAAGDTSEALRLYEQAIARVSTLRSRLASEHASSALSTRASRLYEDAVECAGTTAAWGQLLAFGEAQRAVVLTRLLRTSQAPISPELRSEQEQLQRKLALAVARGSADARLERLIAAYGDAILRGRYETAAVQHEHPAEEMPTLEQVRLALGAIYGQDWSILVYLQASEWYYVLLIEPDDISAEVVHNDASLQSLIGKAVHTTYRPYIFRDAPFYLGQSAIRWETLDKLATQLLPQRLHRRLHKDHRLLVVPSGTLHHLPWAALRFEGDWLVQRAIIQIIPSLASLVNLARQRLLKGTNSLAAGCSQYRGRMPDLPAVPAELALVQRHLGRLCTVLCDEMANRRDVLDYLRTAGQQTLEIVHLACHARLLPKHGLAAHIVLWDGMVFLPEVVRLDLGGAIVVLSACEGATPDYLPGDEVLSLAWAFLGAKASGVVASQWAVADAASPYVMDAFYTVLMETGDAPLALALAQRKMIASTSATGAETPEHWGSFVFIGRGLV